MLGYNPTFYGQCFSDTYITIEPNMIVLVFNKANTQRESEISTKVYDILKENSNFIEYSDTSFYDIFKFKVPDKYKSDFELYIDGKYSKMSSPVKRRVLEFFKNNHSNYKYIDSYLNPDKYFKTYADLLAVPIEVLTEVGELCSLPDFKKETLKLRAEELIKFNIFEQK